MASLLSPRRTDADLALHATVARTERTGEDDAEPQLPPASGLLAAIGGALASALIGWIVVTGVCVLGWLTAATGSFAGALGVGTQLWLLSNGAGAQLGSSVITLVPYGVTLLFALVLSRFAAFAGRHLGTGRERTSPAAGWRNWATLTGVMVAAYAAPVVAVHLLLDAPAPSPPSTVGALLLIVLAAARGSARGLHYQPTASWPDPYQALLRAVLGSQLVLLAAGAGALATGLILHLDRVSQLTASLDAGPGGGLVLLLAQLALLPNAVAWSASYALGAGFSLGPGAVVAPMSTQLGLLPAIPLLGALPRTAEGGLGLWWLTAGVLAGMVSAWLALKSRRALRFDAASLVGGLAGVSSALIVVALAWVCSGDLGTTRLVGLGPRLLPLLVLSSSTLGLAGLLTGLAIGLLRRRSSWRRPRAAAADTVSSEVSSAG